MIAKITRGSGPENLIYYLFGPGKHNEHHNPHVVAGFRPPYELEPPLRASGKRDYRTLTSLLRQPLAAMQGPGFDEPVWHCSLRAAPTDRILTDAEWADIAQEVLHRTRIAPRGDTAACRWVAVRHADDHIHIVATLAREDGRKPRLWNDKRIVRTACQAIEVKYGLVSTAPADQTADRRPTRAETEKARRAGRTEPSRLTLRRKVATAAAGAASETEFFARLQASGVLIRKRYSTRNPGEITGYAVALPGDTNRNGEPFWLRGGELAPDLSMPQLLARWAQPSATGPNPQRSADQPRPRTRNLTFGERQALYEHATEAIIRANDAIRRAGRFYPDHAADAAWAAADVLHVTADILNNPHLRDAADAYARAARSPYRRIPTPTREGAGLRTAARDLAVAGALIGGRSFHTVRILIQNLIALIDAVTELRRSQRRTAQCQAAWEAGHHLRTAANPESANVSRSSTVQQRADGANAAQLAFAGFIPLDEALRIDRARADDPPSPPPLGRPGATPSRRAQR